ncbi:MAG: TIGR00304 family membrane protein [Sulfolobales archaeon]
MSREDLLVLGLLLMFLGVVTISVGLLLASGPRETGGLGVIIIGPIPIIIKGDPGTVIWISIVMLLIFISLMLYLLRRIKSSIDLTGRF